MPGCFFFIMEVGLRPLTLHDFNAKSLSLPLNNSLLFSLIIFPLSCLLHWSVLFLYFLFSIKNVSCEFNTSILHDAVSVISLKSARPNIFADLQVKAVLCQHGEEHLHSVAWRNFPVNHVETLLDAAFLTGLYFSCFLIFLSSVFGLQNAGSWFYSVVAVLV